MLPGARRGAECERPRGRRVVWPARVLDGDASGEPSRTHVGIPSRRVLLLPGRAVSYLRVSSIGVRVVAARASRLVPTWVVDRGARCWCRDEPSRTHVGIRSRRAALLLPARAALVPACVVDRRARCCCRDEPSRTHVGIRSRRAALLLPARPVSYPRGFAPSMRPGRRCLDIRDAVLRHRCSRLAALAPGCGGHLQRPDLRARSPGAGPVGFGQ